MAIGIGLYFRANPNQNEEKLITSQLSYVLQYCSEETRDVTPDNVEINIENGVMLLSHTLNTYCNTNEDNLTLDYKRHGSYLEITEMLQTDTAARCICPLKLGASIADLEPGSYLLKLILDNQYIGEKTEIGQYEFSIEQTEKPDRFVGVNPVILNDVSGGNAQGKAWTVVENGITYHKATATNLPELTNGDFYEGWLVKKSPFDFFSTGEMLFDETSQTWILEYETKGDKSEYTGVVITLEPDDGDPAPAKHIIENEF